MKTPLEELGEFYPSSKYLGRVDKSDTNFASVIMDIEKRLNDIEFKSKKNKRVKATRAQKVLLFHHLGLLDKIIELPISNGKKARLLSVMLDEDQDNLDGDISKVNHPKSDLKKDFNYKFLISIFEEVGLNELAEKSEMILTKIETEKEKKDKK